MYKIHMDGVLTLMAQQLIITLIDYQRYRKIVDKQTSYYRLWLFLYLLREESKMK